MTNPAVGFCCVLTIPVFFFFSSSCNPAGAVTAALLAKEGRG